jgi:chloride channel protein, CIC family
MPLALLDLPPKQGKVKDSGTTSILTELKLGIGVFRSEPCLSTALLILSFVTAALGYAFFWAIAGVEALSNKHPHWSLPFVVAAGGLMSGVANRFTKTKGMALNGALEERKQGIPLKATALLLVMWCTAFLVGTNGSAGIEGPSAVIGMGAGSTLADRFPRFLTAQRHWLESWGMAALVAAMFNSPLAGAFFACEITHRKGGKWRYFPGALVAGTIATTILDRLRGESFLQFPLGVGCLSSVWLLVPGAVLLGGIGGVVSLMYINTLGFVKELIQRTEIPVLLKPALGGLCVGVLGLALPQILGQGHHWIYYPSWVEATPFLVVLLLPLSKILATSLSVSSGGIGGIFFPGLVIGAFTGAACYSMIHALPGIPGVEWFIATTMAAVIGAAAHAPITAICLTIALVPVPYGWFGVALMALSVIVSRMVVRDHTLYPAQD